MQRFGCRICLSVIMLYELGEFERCVKVGGFAL